MLILVDGYQMLQNYVDNIPHEIWEILEKRKAFGLQLLYTAILKIYLQTYWLLTVVSGYASSKKDLPAI